MSIYGPTAESKDADKDAFYDTLTEEMEKEKLVCYIWEETLTQDYLRD